MGSATITDLRGHGHQGGDRRCAARLARGRLRQSRCAVFLLYLVLALATAKALRSVRTEPGSWLGRRSVRRHLVVALAADCGALMASTVWQPALGPALVLVIVLVLLDVALGRATQRLATASDKLLDERQQALRDRAHRLAYWILAMAVGGTIAVADVATPQSRAWLENALTFGGMVVFLQLLFVLPAMTLAWLEPDRLAAEDRPLATDPRAPLALGMLASADHRHSVSPVSRSDASPNQNNQRYIADILAASVRSDLRPMPGVHR